MTDYLFGAPAPQPKPLHNIEAEQALIGALTYEPETFHRLPAGLEPGAFYEPVHGRLYAALRDLIAKGRAAPPEALHSRFSADQAYLQLGGLQYLLNLMDRAPPPYAAPELAALLQTLSTRRTLVRIAAEITERALTAELEEPADELVAEAEASFAAVKLNTGDATPLTAAQASAQVFEHLQADAATVGTVFTGLRPLDQQLGGMMPGELILLGGRPGMGKSTIEGNAALNVAGPHLATLGLTMDRWELDALQRSLPAPSGVLKISGEMPVKQTTWRMLADVAFRLYGAGAPSYKRIRTRTLTPEHRDMLREAQKWFDVLPITQLKRAGLRVSTLRAIARRQKLAWEREGVRFGLLTVDHAGLLAPDEHFRSEYEAQSWIARAMKVMADELEVPVLVLVQLSRQIESREDKRPQLSDLRASGQWEENADVVMMAYREQYYALKEKEPIIDNKTGSQLKWDDWDRRRKSKTLEVGLPKTRDSDGGSVNLWCSIAHHVVRSSEPEDPSRLHLQARDPTGGN